MQSQEIAQKILVIAILFSVASCGQAVKQATTVASGDASLEKLSAFYEACVQGNEPQVRKSLDENPALVNAQTATTKDTPLKRATEFQQLPIVQLLLSSGAKVDLADYHGNTPLMTAAYQGDEAIVDALLHAGANPNAVEDTYGNTPLINAAWKGHIGVVKRLLEGGADPSIRAKDGRTALVRAEQAGRADIVSQINGRAEK